MKLFGLEIGWARKSGGADSIDINTLIRRLEAAYATVSGIAITPETAMQSPTVHAVVTAVSRRISTLPVRVLKKTTSQGRDTKEPQPNHPVTRLLQRPNDWQSCVDFWQDATSTLVRYGNFYAFKARGLTGPVRRLIPFDAGHVKVKQDPDSLDVTYDVHMRSGRINSYELGDLLHARGASRDFLCGDSPIKDCREAIAMEIAAERMGAAVFGNGAMPGVVFQHATGSAGFKTDEERLRFIEDFGRSYAGRSRFKAMLLPKGIELGQQISVDNDKAQFLASRQYQRTVIAGAFGVPPHLVGDLSKGTYNNVEQQSLDFIINVVLPYVRIFESAMERDLLTDEDRRAGIVIRFNLEAALRGDFLSRQQGLNIQRQAGVINANEWRERENMNPRPDPGGEEYYQQGPSGQTGAPSNGDDPAGDKPQSANDQDDDQEQADAA